MYIIIKMVVFDPMKNMFPEQLPPVSATVVFDIEQGTNF